MQILIRKPGRTLWQGAGPDGTTAYEWVANQDGAPFEPASCAHPSKRQADKAWAADNPPGKAGRPPSGLPVSEGNRALAIRFDEATHARIEAKGGTAWVRQLILDSL